MIKQIQKNLTFILSLMLMCNTATAEFYRWVDAQGKAHFSDKKPIQQIAEEIVLKKNPTAKNVESNDSISDDKHVTMYSTAWCGYCKKARNYFRKNKIQFTEYDIEKDSAANARHKNLGGTGVPLILVKNQVMKGFSVPRFEKMYQ